MTLKGKCQTCRSRKVKCDEKKPKCSACLKGNRNCTYSDGTPAAFVVEDPTQYSKHGKAQVAPRVYPLFADGVRSVGNINEVHSTWQGPVATITTDSESGFHVTAERAAGGGGVYRTLALVNKERINNPRRYTHQQKRRLQLHLQYLKRSSTFIHYRVTAPETQLAQRYVAVLNGHPLEEQPLAILGTWVMTIPSRIGNSPHVDLAVEFLTDSVKFFRESNFTNRKVALRSKAKALKALQLEVDQCQTRQTYDTAIAMKIHFAAEVFMGIMDFYHAIHTIALGELLRHGPVTGPDDDHFWSLIDNTYGEDVTEALVASRPSIYDNDYYINATKPANIPPHAPPIQKASMSTMHVAIRLPRLVCLVRYIMEHPDDTESVTMTINLASTLWHVDPTSTVMELLDASITTRPIPPSEEIADIIPDSFFFDSVVTTVLASRFWSTMIALTAVTETLYLNFPEYYAKAVMPEIADVYRQDEESAVGLARCIRYAMSIGPELPLLPLRIYTTWQCSIGTWHRICRRIKKRQEAGEISAADLLKLSQADRMLDWTIEACNQTHEAWGVDRVPKELLLGMVEDMAGGPVHHWIPRAVSFDAEDGEMVMRLKYGIPLPSVNKDDEYQVWDRSTTTRSPFDRNDAVGPKVPPSFMNSPIRVDLGDAPPRSSESVSEHLADIASEFVGAQQHSPNV